MLRIRSGIRGCAYGQHFMGKRHAAIVVLAVKAKPPSAVARKP
jgi:hypothetical protein